MVNLQKEAKKFNDPNASHEQIKNVGLKTIAALYMGKKLEIELNIIRYLCFNKGCQKKNFHLSMLPPTQCAAEQHCY